MKVTIKDIAKRAGVSIATVSRVVNNSKPVKEEVRRRVLTVMKEMNYRAHALPPDLQPGASLIGIVTPQYSNNVLDDFVNGVNTVAKLYGFNTLVGLTDESPASEQHYLRLFGRMPVQGLIFVGSRLTEAHSRILQELGTPCVLAGQSSVFPHIPSVHVDNITASYEAVTYLIQKGHRDIAMIRAAGDTSIGGDRFSGYAQALGDAGLPLREEWIAVSGLSVADGAQAMAQIAAAAVPTAVFCATDWMAIGAMNYLTDQGYRVPEDVAVFGFDGSFMAAIIRPQLSTVEYSATEMGMTAMRNLMKLIKGETVAPHHTNVTHRLSIKGSTN